MSELPSQTQKQIERWKAFTLGSVKAKAATQFQRLVRIRHADRQGNVICCSCGRKGHYKTFDAGHWISRTNGATLYDFQNCHPQCKRCNAYQGGNRDGYDVFMEKTYGKRAMNALRKRASEPKQWTRPELAELVIGWRAETREHESRLKG
jgi:hypothetical protein